MNVKMSKIEKILILAIVLLISGIIGLSTCTVKSVEDAGGLRQVVVDVGKEIKSISEEIQND